jgi:TRAP-type C4-dicarboxylate transport system permease small subunit
MKRKTSIWLWVGFFGLLLILSLDYWRWDEPVTIGWLGFPNWIWWFVGLQVVLVLGLTFFVRNFWEEEEGSS